MPWFEVDDLWVSYGSGAPVLRGVTIAVEQDEIVSIIGPNGAGKSTLMKAISGLVPIAAGRIAFAGRDTSGLRPDQIVALGISQVPEGRMLFPDMTVAENLRLGRYLRKTIEAREDEQRIMQLFPILGERAQQRAGRMSGGEQQMVAIARALMSRPQLLLLDEPSIGLAPQVVSRIGQAIREINTQLGVGIVLVEQNAELALQLAHRAYVLELGRVERTGTSDDLARDREIRKAYLAI